MRKSILFWTIIFILIMLSISFIIGLFNYQFLNWVKISAMVIIFIGITTGTIQLLVRILKKNRAMCIILCIIVVLIECIVIGVTDIFLILCYYNSEEIVIKNGTKMVKETHSVLFSNGITYYDYKNIFIRSKTKRIYEAHDDYIGEYLYTDYYDENGKFIEEVDESWLYK